MALKLPHWAQLVLGLAAVVVAWFMQQNASGSLVLPAALVSALTLLNVVLGVLSPSAKKPLPGGVK